MVEKESSPTNVFQAIKQLAKSIKVFTYKMTLIQKEVRTFRKANIALSKHYKTKRTYI